MTMAPKFSKLSKNPCQYCGTSKEDRWGRCENCRMDDSSGPCRQCGKITRLGRVEREYYREKRWGPYVRLVYNTEYCGACWMR